MTMDPTTSDFARLCIPVLLLAAWQWLRLWLSKEKEVELLVSRDNALEGAKLLREWCTWLATISTSALGVVAFTAIGGARNLEKTLAQLAVASFACSVLFTATLLLALPSLVSRLQASSSKKNDLYEMSAFLWVPKALRPIGRIGFLAAAQYYFFMAGIAIVAYGFAK